MKLLSWVANHKPTNTTPWKLPLLIWKEKTIFIFWNHRLVIWNNWQRTLRLWCAVIFLANKTSGRAQQSVHAHMFPFFVSSALKQHRIFPQLHSCSTLYNFSLHSFGSIFSFVFFRLCHNFLCYKYFAFFDRHFLLFILPLHPI